MNDDVVPLVGIIGSLRTGSIHRALFEAATELAPAGVTLVEAPVRDVPFYDGDLEAAGDPPPVVAFKQAVAGAAGVLFFTPEYNRSVPAVTKNALDWASRLRGDSPIDGKPVGIVAASPGGHDVAGVRSALSLSAAAARARPFEESLGIGSFTDLMVDGRLTDQSTREALAEYVARFVAFVSSLPED